MTINNVKTLLSHGNVAGRKIVLEILKAGFTAADPYENTKKLLRIKDEKLFVGNTNFPVEQPRGNAIQWDPLVFELSDVKNIYVVGGGKAAQRMAYAVEDVLGDLITEGQVNAKKGEPKWCKRINVTFAGHPIPDEDGVEGAKRILEIEKKAKNGDIVFFCESGGGTALLTLPGPGITLEDLNEVNRQLYLVHRTSLGNANSVRWMLVDLRMRHERYVCKNGATLITIHTDEGSQVIKFGTLTRPLRRDRSYQYAIDVLKTAKVWDKAPQPVKSYLLKADPRYGPLRPEEVKGKPSYHFRVMGSEYLLEGARRKAEELGVEANIFASSVNGIEARDVAGVMAYLAREIELHGKPFKPPCVVIFGGEADVTVGPATGMGGRNQEFVLSSAPMIAGSENIVIASADSDGTDGPTYVAGGLVDGYTMARAQNAGVDVFEELANHNSYQVLETLGDHIVTGARGTNVRDLRIIYVANRLSKEDLIGYMSRGLLNSSSFHALTK